MESTALSVGKSVLDGLLGYATSAAAEEVALQLGIQRDHAFIRDEFEMMQAFLMAAHDERDDDKVIKTWVKQVRDVAYDVEYCLLDFAVHVEKLSFWCNPRTLLERRRVAKQIKELRTKVEDVNQRNVRYRLIKGPGSKEIKGPGSKEIKGPGSNEIKGPGSKETTAAGQSRIAGATMSGIDEARRQQNRAKVDLVRLIKEEDKNLKVIAVWGTGGVLGQTSVIKGAYEALKVRKKFECRAWIRLMHPFNPTEFLQSVVEQFYVNSLQEDGEREKATLGTQDLRRMAMMNEDDLADAFKGYVNEKSYLIVLYDISNIGEWGRIKTYFPNNKKGSRIIACTEQVKVASLCVGPESVDPEHIQLSADQTLYAFYEKGSQDVTDSTEAGPSSNNSAGRKKLTRIETMEAALEDSPLIGRVNEKADIVKLVSNKDSQQREVISVWGMGGIGKTTLVRDVYRSQEVRGMFDKRAWVTFMHPFSWEDLRRSLAVQFGDKDETDLARLLEGKRYLIVLDDLSSTTEWDQIIQHLPETAASCIIVTTREEEVAKHCSNGERRNICMLNTLEYQRALDLFTKQVFKEDVDLDEQYPDLAEEAKLILKKCKGLPLAIVTIGGFLANRPKTVFEWRKLNEHISAELEMNPELGEIRTVLNRSYDGLPYHLKSCFLYLFIFPEDCKISRKRLVRRWAAEGYSREVRDKSAEEIADNYFLELIDRGMILPTQKSMYSRRGIDSCQVHDLMREIGISESTEENLVFRLEEGCSSSPPPTICHLAITSSSWEGDKSEFDSMADLFRVRSLTVFGKWMSFFISNKTRLLRVLDLEDTDDLHDHHLEHIGKLLHLKYLSLRGCKGIWYLPDSLGNLRLLETLDVTDTHIGRLPKTIINLRKLNHLRAGHKSRNEDVSYEGNAEEVPKLIKNRLGCFAPHGTMVCCMALPAIAMRLDIHGVVVPRGMSKLKALHTLGVVNIAQGKYVLQDIKGLTRLRKLVVTGVNKKNGQELCSAIADLRRLESLSVRSEGGPGLHGCLESLTLRSEGDGTPSPPENLQSLKLYGNLVKLPEWIAGLKNLVKLKLQSTRLSEHAAAMQVLGYLPNLAILRLWSESFQGEELHFHFHWDGFRRLVMLELDELEHIKSVTFDEGAMPWLEQLQLRSCLVTDENGFSGLNFLHSIKEVLLNVRIPIETWEEKKLKEDKLKEHVRAQLAWNRNRPILKVYVY